MRMHVTFGNPFLMFLYSLSILLLGCAIGLYWKATPGMALWLAIIGALLTVIHDLATGIIWFWVSAKMFSNFQQRKEL